MTLQALKAELLRRLNAAAGQTGLPIDVAYEANEILRLCAGYDRTAVLLDGDKTVEPDAASRMLHIADCRRDGTPLGYLIGQSPFCGLDFLVCDGEQKTLIPRADTELTVELLCGMLHGGDVFLDLCCGSGCIALSALTNIENTRADGVEKDAGARCIAQKNAERFSLSDRFRPILGDVLSGDCPGTGYRCIVSNPPYIPTGDLTGLDCQVQNEPRMALDGGEDGMVFYRAILSKYAQYLLPDGAFLFEIGYDEGKKITELAAAYGFAAVLHRDFGDHDRAAVLTRIL